MQASTPSPNPQRPWAPLAPASLSKHSTTEHALPETEGHEGSDTEDSDNPRVTVKAKPGGGDCAPIKLFYTKVDKGNRSDMRYCCVCE